MATLAGVTDDPLATQARLDAAFGLAATDRAANAAGRLSGRQRAELLVGSGTGTLGALLGFAVGVVAAVGDHFVIASLGLTLGGNLLLRVFLPFGDAARGRVKMAEGPIEPDGRLFALIGPLQLRFPPGVLEALPTDVTAWRVYYLPGSRRAIALEPAPSTSTGPFR
jgi:hypothetical protein